MFINGFTARLKESPTQDEEPQTMPLDDEFLHLDFLKYAHTIASSGARPNDAHTADLVTSLLAVSRLSARIACELTWNEITADNEGILTARRDMARVHRDYEDQIQRTIASGDAHRLRARSTMPPPPLPNMSQLVDQGNASEETVAHWTSDAMTTLLKDALVERLKVPLFALLKEDLHDSLLKSLTADLYGDLLRQLSSPLQEGLKDPLMADIAPRVLAGAQAKMDELLGYYRTEVTHEAAMLEKRELKVRKREEDLAHAVKRDRDDALTRDDPYTRTLDRALTLDCSRDIDIDHAREHSKRIRSN
ncbi:hypothetical protein TRAPUB_10984 [Trametes pubescens]|uniref:Uncharacterized protein n=1 Tax=Trametes pubescens TaxID=154538 RepID=A0A1M2VXY1_TRAPU|nr:hypothetical protein TRAPUB_10984 [Trametes pubescens]